MSFFLHVVLHCHDGAKWFSSVYLEVDFKVFIAVFKVLHSNKVHLLCHPSTWNLHAPSLLCRKAFPFHAMKLLSFFLFGKVECFRGDMLWLIKNTCSVIRCQKLNSLLTLQKFKPTFFASFYVPSYVPIVRKSIEFKFYEI